MAEVSAIIVRMGAWTEAGEEAFARSVLRRRWLSALQRVGVVTVGQVRAMSERDRELVGMRESGARIAEIARRFGISSVGVRQILERTG